MQRNHSFKLKNPYKPDEKITQEVSISNKLQYDYSKSKWISVDAEFLGLNMCRDALCTIQIASSDLNDDLKQRVEIIYVYNQKIDPKLKKLLESNILKIFHVFSLDIPMLNKYLDIEIKGPVFDTKVAAKIVWTNCQLTNKTSLIKNFADPDFMNLEESGAKWELEPEHWSNKMIEYASLDVLYLNSIRLKLEEMAKRRNRVEVLHKALEALPILGAVYEQGYDLSVYDFSN